MSMSHLWILRLLAHSSSTIHDFHWFHRLALWHVQHQCLLFYLNISSTRHCSSKVKTECWNNQRSWALLWEWMTILPKTQPRVTWWLTVLVYMKEIQQIVLTLRSTRLLKLKDIEPATLATQADQGRNHVWSFFESCRPCRWVSLIVHYMDVGWSYPADLQGNAMYWGYPGPGGNWKNGNLLGWKNTKNLVSWMNWAESWAWSLSETCRLSSDMLGFKYTWWCRASRASG